MFKGPWRDQESSARQRKSGNQKFGGSVTKLILDSHCHLERFPNPKAVAADAARRGVFTIAVTNLQAISERIATRSESSSDSIGARISSACDPYSEEQHCLRFIPPHIVHWRSSLDFSREGKILAPANGGLSIYCRDDCSNPKVVSLHSRGAEAQYWTSSLY